MDTEAALFEAYQDWRRLAELEGEGIRAADWRLVADCQNRLSALQTRLIRLTSEARQQWRRTGADLAQKEETLRQTISGLMELERENSASLSATQEIARLKLNQLSAVTRTLKRVERSYSTAASTGWNSLS